MDGSGERAVRTAPDPYDWAQLRSWAKQFNADRGARRVSVTIRYHRAVRELKRGKAAAKWYQPRMSKRTWVIGSIAAVLLAVRWLVFPMWSPFFLVAGLVCIDITLTTTVISRVARGITIGDRRGGYLNLHRGRGCVEVGGWHYYPRVGPGAEQARQSAYEVAAAIARYAEENTVYLATAPATPWHAELYARFGFSAPQTPDRRVSLLSQLLARIDGHATPRR